MTILRRTSIALLALLIGASLAPAVASAAKEDSSPTAELRKELKFVKDQLKDRRAHNDEIIAYLGAFAKAYGELEDDAKDTASLKADIRAILLRVMKYDLVRKEQNLRSAANIRAAQILGDLAPGMETKYRRKLGGSAITEFKRLKDVKKYEPSEDRIEIVAALAARMDGAAALKYFRKKQLRTDNADVQYTVAALKAMLLVDELSSRTRYDLFDYMLARYAGTEATAEQSATDSATQAAKRFWDEARTHVIAVMQRLARTPMDEKQVALKTMGEFQTWFRQHKNPRGEPWVLPKTTAVTKSK